MLSELSEMLEKTGEMDSIVIEQYNMKNGLYIKLDKTGSITDSLVINKDIGIFSESYKWFKERDYYSKLIEMNKPVDSKKKIHSNNMYTMFIKCTNLPEVGDSTALSYEDFSEVVNGYYQKLNREYDKREKEILGLFNIEKIDYEESEVYKNLLINSIEKIVAFIKGLDKESGFSNKEYVKVFIESDENSAEDINNYIRESNRYFLPKVFNNNKENVLIGNDIYGLSNENMGLNAKKPYLEMKNTKFKVPYRVPLNDAVRNHRLMEWIDNARDDKSSIITKFGINYGYDFKSKPEMNYSEPGIFFETMPTKTGTVIKDINIIPKNIEKIREFKYENYLGLENGDISSTKKRAQLEEYVDKIFFKNQMRIFYYNSEFKPKGLNGYYINAMEVMKEPMKSFFRLGIDDSLNYIIDKMTFGMVMNSALDDDTSDYNVRSKMNLRLNLLKYFNIGGKKNMGDILKEIVDKVRIKVSSANFISIESDDEYYYCVGQMIYYLCSLSETKNKKHSMYNGVLNARKNEKLRRVILDLYKAHNYKVYEENMKFKRLFEMIERYRVDNSVVDEDLLLCGILSNNLLYEKKEEK